MTSNDASALQPLVGVRIVVTRARHQSAALGAMLERAGAEVIYVPVIATIDPPSWDPVDRAVQELARGSYSWVIFTSVNGVERFFSRVSAAGLDPGAFNDTKVAAVGHITGQSLRAHGVEPHLIPEVFTAESLARGLARGTGRVLIPRAANAPKDTIAALERAGWIPEDVPTHVTVPGSPESPQVSAVRSGEFDVVCFASGSAARHFPSIVGSPRELRLSRDDPPTKKVVCIGPKTAAAAEAEGFRVDSIAEEHTSEGLVAALARASFD